MISGRNTVNRVRIRKEHASTVHFCLCSDDCYLFGVPRETLCKHMYKHNICICILVKRLTTKKRKDETRSCRGRGKRVPRSRCWKIFSNRKMCRRNLKTVYWREYCSRKRSLYNAVANVRCFAQSASFNFCEERNLDEED